MEMRRSRLVMASVLAGLAFLFVIILVVYLVASSQRRANAVTVLTDAPTPTPVTGVAPPASTFPPARPTEAAPAPTPAAPATAPVVTPPPLPPPAQATVAAVPPTPPPTPSPPPATATPAVAQATPQPVEAVIAAALAAYDAVPEADCQSNNPQRKPCLSLRSTPEQVQRGIALFNVSVPGSTAAIGVLGRDPAGAWKRWFGYQTAPYQLLQLPGEARVCAEGARLELRASPDPGAQVVAQLNPLATVRAEEFVLTQPEVMERQANGQVVLRPGNGWYRLTGAQTGWAPSRSLSDARYNDCALRDATERAR
jgi:hypothetical protein